MKLNFGRKGLLYQLPSWLASPVFEGCEEKTRQAGLLNMIGLISILFTCLVMVSSILDDTMLPVTLLIDLLACMVMVQFLLWLRRGRVILASFGFILFGLVFVTSATASLGGIADPTAAIFVFWVLMAGILFDLRGIVLGTVAASLAILGLIVAKNAGWLATPPYVPGTSVSDWVTYTALFAFTSGLTYYINQGTQRALTLAQTEVKQRLQAEALLNAAQNKLQGIINGLPDLLFEVSLNGVIHDYRSPRSDLQAAPPQAILGKNLSDFLPSQAAQHAIDAIKEATFNGQFSRTIYALELAHGTRWFEMSFSAKPGCDEQDQRYICVSRDITEHKQLVSELQQARDVAQAAQHALQIANEDLSRISITDPLTGIYNRRHFVKMADAERARVKRYKTKLSMLIFDIDHFKSINDNYGHPTGDSVLIEITQLVSSAIRQGDVLARWGGEEFVVLMPQCGMPEAQQLAEKLRALIAAHPFSEVRTVTASLGAAEIKPDELLDDWLKRVDLALYAAKSGGRNRVCLAD